MYRYVVQAVKGVLYHLVVRAEQATVCRCRMKCARVVRHTPVCTLQARNNKPYCGKVVLRHRMYAEVILWSGGSPPSVLDTPSGGMLRGTLPLQARSHAPTDITTRAGGHTIICARGASVERIKQHRCHALSRLSVTPGRLALRKINRMQNASCFLSRHRSTAVAFHGLRLTPINATHGSPA